MGELHGGRGLIYSAESPFPADAVDSPAGLRGERHGEGEVGSLYVEDGVAGEGVGRKRRNQACQEEKCGPQNRKPDFFLIGVVILPVLLWRRIPLFPDAGVAARWGRRAHGPRRRAVPEGFFG